MDNYILPYLFENCTSEANFFVAIAGPANCTGNSWNACWETAVELRGGRGRVASELRTIAEALYAET